MIGVFTIVFTVLLPSQPIGVPYPVFLLPALLAWNFHAAGTLGGMQSVVGNAGLLGKVSFPREALPISSVLANGVNFLLALVILLPVMFLLGVGPSFLWLAFPVVFLAQTMFTLGIAFFLSAVNVYFRDTSVIVDVVMLAWLFLTPIFYDLRVIQAHGGIDLAQLVPLLNPMATYIAAYREIFVTHATPGPFFLGRALITGLITCGLGFWIFRRLSRGFGDVL